MASLIIGIAVGHEAGVIVDLHRNLAELLGKATVVSVVASLVS